MTSEHEEVKQAIKSNTYPPTVSKKERKIAKKTARRKKYGTDPSALQDHDSNGAPQPSSSSVRLEDIIDDSADFECTSTFTFRYPSKQ